jgi:HPt (histidine-containing phosphotransfer) domain-containing protein
MADKAVFNLDEALARVEQDREILQTMVELFMEQGPKDLADIKAAVAVRNAAAVARSAHRLKGAVLQFCAPAAIMATREVEQMGKSDDLTCIDDAYARMETELVCLFASLRASLARGLAA